MDIKVIFVLITIGLVSISPQVFGDEEIGTVVVEDIITFKVGKFEDVEVEHVIKSGAWSQNNPKFLQILLGDHSNLMVTDEDGDRLSFSYKETSENLKFVQLNQKAAGLDLVVTYELKNFMEKNNGMWGKDLVFPTDVVILFENDIELIFVNERPIDVKNVKGINCVGCGMQLKFFDDETATTKKINKFGETLNIEVLSNKNISQFAFNEEINLLNFSVEGDEHLIVLKIPLKLILNPYEVYFTENDDKSLDQIDKIRKTEFYQDDEYVKVSFKTTQDGVVSIVGTTQEQHEMLLDRIEKRISSEVESKDLEEKKGIPLPLPGTGINIEGDEHETDDNPELSFADDLKNTENDSSSENLENDSTVFGIVVAVAVAITIIGIIIKMKRN